MTTPDDPRRTSHHSLFVLAFFVWLELGLGLGLGLLYGTLRGFVLIVGGCSNWGNCVVWLVGGSLGGRRLLGGRWACGN